jgi:hypothetical protein
MVKRGVALRRYDSRHIASCACRAPLPHKDPAMTARRADQWDIAKLKAALLDDHTELSDDEFAAVREFIEQIGGLENAQSAVELLEQLELEGDLDDFEEIDEDEFDALEDDDTFDDLDDAA